MLSGSIDLADHRGHWDVPLLAISVSKEQKRFSGTTVTDSTMQLMYLPLPTLVRGRAKL